MLKNSYFLSKICFFCSFLRTFPLPTPFLFHEVVPLPETIFLPPTPSRFLVPPSPQLFWCPRMSGQSLTYARRSFQARKRRGRRRTRVGKSILISRKGGRAFVGKSGQHRVKFEPRPTDRLRKIERKGDSRAGVILDTNRKAWQQDDRFARQKKGLFHPHT